MRSNDQPTEVKSHSAFTALGLLLSACVWLLPLTQPKAGEVPGISLLDFGALPDGTSDSTEAIEAAISTAKSRHGFVLVPKGIFVHRGFALDGVAMAGTGPGSVLLAPNPEDASIYLRDNGPALRDVSVKVRSSRRDTRNPAIFVDRATGFAVERVSVEGGNDGGILDFGGSHGKIVGNRVQDTLADAIHNTYGAHDILVARNTVRRSGDDMVAVVSYGNENLCHDILIEHNDLADQKWGRGISVVGGERVTIQYNQIGRTDCCAGIYIADETVYKTHGVADVLVRDNMLADNSGSTGHGAIMLFADQGSVHDVRVERNTIRRSRHAGVRLRGAVTRIELISNRIFDPAGPAFTSDGAEAYCVGNLLNGRAVTPSFCNARDEMRVTGASPEAGRALKAGR